MLGITAIQELCRKILDEKDPIKAQQLITELRETIAVDSGETRLRLGFMAKFLKKAEKGPPKLIPILSSRILRSRTSAPAGDIPHARLSNVLPAEVWLRKDSTWEPSSLFVFIPLESTGFSTHLWRSLKARSSHAIQQWRPLLRTSLGSRATGFLDDFSDCSDCSRRGSEHAYLIFRTNNLHVQP